MAQSLEQTKVGIRFKAPKTARGRRTVDLPGLTVDVLRQHRKDQLEERMSLGLGRDELGLVFTAIDGKPVNIERVSREFPRLVGRAKVPAITFHGLRHSHITQLLRSNVHPKVASERAGHSSISVTMDIYSHVLPGMQREAADKVDAALRLALEE